MRGRMGRRAAAWVVLAAAAWLACPAAQADETDYAPHNWELAGGLNVLSYGRYDGMGDDGHFDPFSTVFGVGPEVALRYRVSRWLAGGGNASYVFSMGRTDIWENRVKPLVHKVRLAPVVQIRLPGNSVEPYVRLSGGFAALSSKNWDDPYDAAGWFAALGLGSNIHFTDRLGMYVCYSAHVDWLTIHNVEGGYAGYLEDSAVVAFLMEVTAGLLYRF